MDILKKLTAICIAVSLLSAMCLCSCTNSAGDDTAAQTSSASQQQSAADETGLTFTRWAEFIDAGKYPAVKAYKNTGDAWICTITADAPEKTTIPAEHEGLPVRAVICTDNGMDSIRELTISEGTVIIEGLAGTKNDTLEKIVLPESIEQISGSFNGCSKLTEVSIPGDPKLIENSFTGSGIRAITFGKLSGLISGSFCELPSLNEITFGEIDNVSFTGTFKKLEAVEKLTFNGTVDFDNSMNEKEQFFNSYLFNDIKTLTSVTFNGEIKLLPECFCDDCDKLSSVTFNGKVGKLQHGDFNDCEKLETIVFGDAVEMIEEHCFTSGSITRLVFEHEVGTIGPYCFQSNTDLKELVFRDKVGSLTKCFDLCKSLESVTFESTVGTVDDSLNTCKVLKTVEFKKDVDEISNSFRKCPELESVIFGGKVNKITNAAFSSSDSVKLVNMPSTVEFGSDSLSQRFDPSLQKYRGYYEKLDKYSVKYLKEWIKENAAGKKLDSSKEISISNATAYADVLNGPLVTNSRCTDCPYEEYGPEAGQDAELFVQNISSIQSVHPNTIYTDDKALKVSEGKAPLVIGYCESMGYIPVEYIDTDGSGKTETLYYEMMRVSLWNIETGELIAWYDHRDGEAPVKYNTHDRSDYTYHESLSQDHKFYFFSGGYEYPEAMLWNTIYPDQ